MKPNLLSISMILLWLAPFETVLANACHQLDWDWGRDAHNAITEDLFRGSVVEATPFSANGSRTTLIAVRIHNRGNGSYRDAFFKPREPGDNEGWGRSPGEFLAYRMNRLLGMDYVPPVAYRRWLEANFETHGEGAIIHRVADAHNLKDVPHDQWGQRVDLFFSDVRILDILIQNPDRHELNFLRGKHWVDGNYQPILIDHAAAMRPGTIVSLEQHGALGAGPVEVVRKRTWDALFRLDFATLKREFGEFYSDGEINQMLQIRDGVSAHFHNLADARGWESVVIQE